MDEYIDVLDSVNGLKTGETVLKSDAHRNGIWHASVHMLLVNYDASLVLLQKRSVEKDLFPGMWDISAAGHVSASEDAFTAAKREFSEELGLDPDDFEFIRVCRVKEELADRGFVSNEFVTIYVVQGDISINDMTLQREEVSDVKWFTKDEFIQLLDDSLLVPHEASYRLLFGILA